MDFQDSEKIHRLPFPVALTPFSANFGPETPPIHTKSAPVLPRHRGVALSTRADELLPLSVSSHDPREISECSQLFDMLHIKALPEAESLDLIRNYMKEYDNG